MILPLAGLLTAVLLLWGSGVTWVSLTALVGMYTLSGFGVTVGYHRLFTHRAFETVRPIKYTLAILGSMAVEGPLSHWVATHRRHHQHSDDEHDPHSPHKYGGGVAGILKGFWHAHLGWLFAPKATDLSRYARDIDADPGLRLISRLFPLWVALGIFIPGVFAGLVTQTWEGAALGLLWGGLVRICVVHHATWAINSVCHLWGQQPFASRDESRNNFICGFLAFGEGWHNNHHAFPNSARHGLRWWELDLSFALIRLLERFGLAWQVRQPKPAALAKRRRAQRTDPATSPPARAA